MKTEPLDLSYLADLDVVGINLLEEHASFDFEAEGKDPVTSLDGKWKFLRAPRFEESLLGDLDFKEIDVPKSVEVEYKEDLHYINDGYPFEAHENLKAGDVDLSRSKVNVYQKEFKRPEGSKIILTIEGFESAIYVYLNGHFVGFSKRMYVDSEFDLTPYLEDENILRIYNFAWSSANWFLSQDYWRFSGIFRSVKLISIPSSHLKDVEVKTDLVNGFRDGVFSIKGEIEGEPCQVKMKLDGKLYEAYGNSFSFDGLYPFVIPWSAEKPNLYLIEIELVHPSGKTIEKVSFNIGFSHEEIKDGVLYWNGRKLFIKGVNRHEISSLGGRYVNYEELETDLRLMKLHNINAIRTSHYPNDKRFYDLADKLGFYVMDEACIESHGVWDNSKGDRTKWIPGDNPRWEKTTFDRIESMYKRDRNHACIFSWSLGNESAGGSVFAKMADHLHSWDKKRVVHYEGANYDLPLYEHLDMYSFMYIKPNDLKKHLKEHKDKPTILCEYSHAMGNSCGNFDEYMDIFRNDLHAVGGFVWDWIDQGLWIDGKYYYGGDALEHPHSGNFNCNGVIFSDREIAEKSMKLKNISKSYFPVQVKFSSDKAILEFDPGDYHPEDFGFTYIELHKGEERKTIDLELNEDSTLDLPKKKAGDLDTIRCLEIREDEGDGLCYFDEDVGAFSIENPKESPMNLACTNRYLSYSGNNTEFYFDTRGKQFGLTGIEIDGKQILYFNPRPIFWRPSTDNDRANKFAYNSSIYMGMEQFAYPDLDKSKKEVVDGKTKITTVYTLNKEGAFAEISYTLENGSYLDIDIKYHGSKSMPSMPCFGIDFPLVKDIDELTYYGKGEVDSYVDAEQGSRLGLYKLHPSDYLLPYSIPQECGHKSHVRFAEFRCNGKTIKVSALSNVFGLKFLPFTNLEIENAKHPHELTNSVCNHLSIFAFMRGVGGDDTWGAPVHPQYEYDGSGEYSLSFRLEVI